MRTVPFAVALAVVLGIAAIAHAQSVESLWNSNCATCHHTSGKGGNAKSLLDDEWKYGGSNRELFDSIRDGRPDDGMEAYSETLTDPQIWGLVVYLHELRHQDFRKRVGNPKPDADGVYTSTRAKYRVETVIPEGQGLRTPWGIAWLPDGSMLVTNRPGQLRVFKDNQLSEPVKDTPAVREDGQGGLMAVTVHPEHAKNGWIYLAFTDPRDAGSGRGPTMTKVVRGKITNNAWTNEETIFKARTEHYLGGGLHFGSRIVFKKAADITGDGRYHLFFSIGERGRGDHAQNLSLPNGKVHRLWDDGKIPDDNPFVSTANAYPSIWSLGHRNPQGLTLDASGNLWDTEHGPRGGDEVNLIVKGRNYGWPLVSFGINYTGSPYKTPWLADEGASLTGGPIVQPAALWLPSVGACGLDLIRGPAFPGWEGDLVAGGLSGANVDRFRFKVSGPTDHPTGELVEREELLRGMGRVRDTAVGPDGMVYVVLNGPDKVIRLAPVK